VTPIGQQNQSIQEKWLVLREKSLLKVLRLVLFERVAFGTLCIDVYIRHCVAASCRLLYPDPECRLDRRAHAKLFLARARAASCGAHGRPPHMY
jgi:hypothetical protein